MRKKILNHTCILVVVSVLLTFLAAGLVMYGKYNEDLKESVRDSLKYVQDGVEKMGNSYLDDALGKATSARITLLDPKGNVLFDSLENSAELENHSNRPEFIQAEKNGYAESLRYSETLSKQNFYCAVKLADGDILRVGRTTDSVFYTMLSSSVLLGGLLILIFAVTFILVRKQTKDLIEPINTLNLEEPLKDVAYEELRPLLGRVDQQNKQIAKQMEELKEAEAVRREFSANVSHELKTPLTSIINYIGLLRREKIDNPNAESYIEVLESKAMRLKQLMEDLVDVSRISSGNVILQMDDIDLVELVRQTGGEFNEKLEQKGLNVISKFPKEAVMIYADGRQLWRVIGNLYNNTSKYAMPDTRVYVEVAKDGYEASFTMKNISEKLLNVDADALAERFVRWDESRSTEGSGLGLSISKMLTELMGGKFEISLEDDLFRVKVTFRCKE